MNAIFICLWNALLYGERTELSQEAIMYKGTECTALNENVSNSIVAVLRFKNTSLLFCPSLLFLRPSKRMCSNDPEVPDFHLDK